MKKLATLLLGALLSLNAAASSLFTPALLPANNLSDVSSAATARTNLGATTVGANIFTLTNPSAITFLRLNANNTITAQTAANFRIDLGVGTTDAPTFAGLTASGGTFNLSGNISAASWTTAGIGLKTTAATYTDTTSSGTIARESIHVFAQPTLAASSATTFTRAATVEITGAPTAGTNVTISSPRSLYVGGGTVEFQSAFNVQGAVLINNSNNATTGINTGTTNSDVTIGGTSNNLVVSAATVKYGTKVAVSTTAPTISSGFGTSPSVPNSNGTSAFTVNVGTGGTANSGVVAMPAANAGWACSVTDITTTSTTVFLTKQTATTTTSVTVGNFNSTTGTAAAWAASDILSFVCFAY